MVCMIVAFNAIISPNAYLHSWMNCIDAFVNVCSVLALIPPLNTMAFIKYVKIVRMVRITRPLKKLVRSKALSAAVDALAHSNKVVEECHGGTSGWGGVTTTRVTALRPARSRTRRCARS
jgi:hypothetical protein